MTQSNICLYTRETDIFPGSEDRPPKTTFHLGRGVWPWAEFFSPRWRVGGISPGAEAALDGCPGESNQSSRYPAVVQGQIRALGLGQRSDGGEKFLVWLVQRVPLCRRQELLLAVTGSQTETAGYGGVSGCHGPVTKSEGDKGLNQEAEDMGEDEAGKANRQMTERRWSQTPSGRPTLLLPAKVDQQSWGSRPAEILKTLSKTSEMTVFRHYSRGSTERRERGYTNRPEPV